MTKIEENISYFNNKCIITVLGDNCAIIKFVRFKSHKNPHKTMLCLYDYNPAQKGKSSQRKKECIIKTIWNFCCSMMLQILPILAKTTKLLCKNNPDEFFEALIFWDTTIIGSLKLVFLIYRLLTKPDFY